MWEAPSPRAKRAGARTACDRWRVAHGPRPIGGRNPGGTDGRIAAGRSDDATHNVAKTVFDFLISIPRNALQTRYGEMFGGAGRVFLPSRLVPGGGHDEAEGEESAKAEGSRLVQTQPVGTCRTGGSV